MPLSIFAFVYAVISLFLFKGGAFQSDNIETFIAPVCTLIGCVILIFVWRVIAGFLLGGRGELAKLHSVYFIVCWFGALLAIHSLLTLLFFSKNDSSDLLTTIAIANSLSIPALIPFIHVFLERKYAKK